MTTLYQSPGACSLAPLIAINAAGLPHDTQRVDLGAHKLTDGSDYYAVNPKGAVPAIRLDSGDVLTENAVILQYIGDQAPNSGLLPASGIDRYRQIELLNYVATEVHKGFSPLFNPATLPETRTQTVETLGKKFSYLSKTLEGQPFLAGDHFTAADAYLFTILRWTDFKQIDLSPWPALVAYRQRIAELPAVKAALEEGRGR